MKSWGIIALGGVAAYLALKASGIAAFVQNLSVAIKNFSVPRIESGFLVFPVTIAFDNHSNTSFRIDRIIATVYLYETKPPWLGEWVQIGSSKPFADGYNIEANKRTEATIEPSVSIAELVTKIGYAAAINPASLLNQQFKVELKAIKAGRVLAETVKIIGNNDNQPGGGLFG